MREIGSEFWNSLSEFQNGEMCENTTNQCFILSGRTALDLICRDSGIKSVMLPSYCCHTMIEPFLRNSVNVHFYSVDISGTRNDISELCDAVLLIDYFGYETPCMTESARIFSALGKIVIYDGTHKLNGNPAIEKYADYSLISYRKWTYSNCAYLKKHKGPFNISIPARENKTYIGLRDRAAEEKKNYISTGFGDKKIFLDIFSDAEEVLEKDYVDYSGRGFVPDISGIICKRKENASYLLSGLQSLPTIELLRSRIGENDSPLCVPILLQDKETRDKLRRHLISNDIYCPVHWPLSELHLINESDKGIYLRELSLICDQRYGVEDMKRELDEIITFFERTSV